MYQTSELERHQFLRSYALDYEMAKLKEDLEHSSEFRCLVLRNIFI